MADNRKKIDNIKDYILDIKEYDDILDDVIALLSSRAEIISDISGYDKGMIFIALQEMVGLVEEYTAEDINNELFNEKGVM